MDQHDAAVDQPSTWYGVGSIVLDRFFNTHMAAEVSIIFRGAPPDRNDVARSLNLSRRQVLLYADQSYRAVCNIDDLIVTSDAKIDSASRDFDPTVPLALTVGRFELSAAEVIRLAGWLAAYPDLQAPDVLRERLRADMAHLRAMANGHDDLTHLLESTRTSFRSEA